MNRKLTIPLIIIVIAFIILPTGTPEDLVTTVPIIGAIGMPSFILLCAGVLGLLYITGVWRKFATMLHIPPQILVLLFVLLIVIYLGVESA